MQQKRTKTHLIVIECGQKKNVIANQIVTYFEIYLQWRRFPKGIISRLVYIYLFKLDCDASL